MVKQFGSYTSRSLHRVQSNIISSREEVNWKSSLTYISCSIITWYYITIETFNLFNKDYMEEYMSCTLSFPESENWQNCTFILSLDIYIDIKKELFCKRINMQRQCHSSPNYRLRSVHEYFIMPFFNSYAPVSVSKLISRAIFRWIPNTYVPYEQQMRSLRGFSRLYE